MSTQDNGGDNELIRELLEYKVEVERRLTILETKQSAFEQQLKDIREEYVSVKNMFRATTITLVITIILNIILRILGL